MQPHLSSLKRNFLVQRSGWWSFGFSLEFEALLGSLSAWVAGNYATRWMLNWNIRVEQQQSRKFEFGFSLNFFHWIYCTFPKDKLLFHRKIKRKSTEDRRKFSMLWVRAAGRHYPTAFRHTFLFHAVAHFFLFRRAAKSNLNSCAKEKWRKVLRCVVRGEFSWLPRCKTIRRGEVYGN
jgi:hypothetical protein